MEPAVLIAYASLAAMSAVVTLITLFFTKNAAVVAPLAAFVSATAYLGWARIQEGHWDKFVAVAFAVSFMFALVVAIGVLYLGRWLGAAHFEDKNAS